MVGRRPLRSPGQKGFTLTEAMVALSLTAILAALAGPSFNNLIATTQVKAASSELQAGLLLARSEAAKRSQAVRVLSGDGKWHTGWQVLDARDNVLLTGAEHLPVRVSGPDSVTFDRAGRVVGNARPSFEVQHKDNIGRLRCLQIELSGRAHVAEGACA